MKVEAGRMALGGAIAVLLALGAGTGMAACGGDGDGGGGAYGPSETTGAAERESTQGTEATTPGEPAVETISVRDGEPVGGVAELVYSAGEQARFRVRSDVADEVHVHGYDLTEDVPAGGTVSFSFPAELEGIFEVELEEQGVEIAELRVEP